MALTDKTRGYMLFTVWRLCLYMGAQQTSSVVWVLRRGFSWHRLRFRIHPLWLQWSAWWLHIAG